MEPFLTRLLITIGVIVLTQIILDAFNVREPAKNIVFVVTVIVMVLFLLTGGFLLTLR